MIVHHASSRFVSFNWACVGPVFKWCVLCFMVFNSVLIIYFSCLWFIMIETVCWYFVWMFLSEIMFSSAFKTIMLWSCFFSRLWIVFVCFVVMLFLQCVLRMFYHILYHGFITFFKASLYRFLEHSDLVTFYSVLSCFCYLIAYVITLQTSVKKLFQVKTIYSKKSQLIHKRWIIL